MKKTHSLNEADKLKHLSDIITEAPRYSTSPSQSLMVVGAAYMDLISNLEFTAKKLARTGNEASAASINNIIGSLEQGIDLLDAAKSDLGK